MSSDYWVANSFGTSASNIGYITWNVNTNMSIYREWGLDPSDNNVIFIIWINDYPLQNYTAYVKLTKEGNYVSTKYSGNHVSFNNLGELLDTYNNATSSPGGNTYSVAFFKDANFPAKNFNTSGGNWDYTNCTNMNQNFKNCRRLGLGTGAAFRMNGCNLVNLYEGTYGGLYGMFEDAFGYGITSSTSNADDFYSVGSINSENVELKNWTISSATGSIKGIGMQIMFQNCYRFDGDVSGWTIRSPKINLHKVFNECHYFRGKGLSTWDVDAKQPIGIFNHLNNSDWETFPDGATPTITIEEMKGYGGSNNLGIVSINVATHGAVKQWALDTDNNIIITETDYYHSSGGHTIFMKITLDGVKVENSGKKREGWNGPFGTAADLIWFYKYGATTSVSSLTYTFAPGPNFDNMDFTDTNAFNHYTVNNIGYLVQQDHTYDALKYPSYITQSVKQNVDRISATIDVDTTAVNEVFFVILASSSVFEAPSGTWAGSPGPADENAEYYGVYVNPTPKWIGFEKVFGSTVATLRDVGNFYADEWDRQITVEYENGVITLKLGQEQVSVYTWKPVHTGKWYGVVGAGCDVTFKNVSLESKTGSQPFRMDYMFYKCYQLGNQQNIDISDSTNGAYIMLYRGGHTYNNVYIDINTIKAYNINNTEISPVSWTHLGSDNTFPMDNALIDGHTTHGYGMWSTNGSGSNGYSGGWIKYPEMPYRMVIETRYNNGRIPDYLKTSYGARLPVGTDFLEWDTKYEFVVDGSTTTYDIFLGGGNCWNYTNCSSIASAFECCRSLGRPIADPIIIGWWNGIPAPYGGESGPNGELAANGARGDILYLARGKTYLLDFRSSLNGNDELEDLYNHGTSGHFEPGGKSGRDIKLTTDNHSQNGATYGNYTPYTGSEVQYDEPGDDQIIITITDTTPNTLYIYQVNMANQNSTRSTITIVDEVESIGVFKMDGCNLIHLDLAAMALHEVFNEAFGYNTWLSTSDSYNFDYYGPIASDKVSFQNWTVRMSSRIVGSYLASCFLNSKQLNANFRGWIIYDLQNTNSMFKECNFFEGIGLSTWTFIARDVASGNDFNFTLNMGYMFYNCVKFDEDISDWPAASMTNEASSNFTSYGYGCTAMFANGDTDFSNSQITYFDDST